MSFSKLLIHVDLGNGLYAEIQVHVREMLDAKEISHVYYERQRTLEEIGLKKLTAKQFAEYNRLNKTQLELHTAASKAFTRRTKLSLETLWP